MDAERVGRRKNGEDKQPDLLPPAGPWFEILPGVCGKLPRTGHDGFSRQWKLFAVSGQFPRKAVSGFSTNKAEGKNRCLPCQRKTSLPEYLPCANVCIVWQP
jgi:hypothetical protein